MIKGIDSRKPDKLQAQDHWMNENSPERSIAPLTASVLVSANVKVFALICFKFLVERTLKGLRHAATDAVFKDEFGQAVLSKNKSYLRMDEWMMFVFENMMFT